ncbi:MAG TPA: SLOG family protein [Solirubrobacterales bacterium]|nr:SLOG family protein [Solirubrobacterales bacterium]
MTENTMTESKMEATSTEAVPVPAVLRTFAVGPICAISKWTALQDGSGDGVCRITILGDPPGPASSPPKITFYVKDGGFPEQGYPLRPDEARRCAAGLEVGDRVEIIGNVGPERASADRQEVIVTQEVKKKKPAADPDARPADPMWITPPKVPFRGGDASRQAARRVNVSGGPLVVLFSGSRRWRDRDRVRRDLEGLPAGSLIIEGGAHGLDKIANEEATALGFHVATVDALWKVYGKPAGYRRNQAMAMLQPDFLYAYPLHDSVGTRQMIEIAERESIQVREA